MATKLGVINTALTLLGEQPVTQADLDASGAAQPERAETANQLYADEVEWLMAVYPWRFTQKRAQLVENVGAQPPMEWSRAFDLPADRIAPPKAVFNSNDKTAASRPVTDWEIEGDVIFTNDLALWIEYQFAAAEASWPGYFTKVAARAMAAAMAIPVTDQRGDYERFMIEAFGSPVEKGRGGLLGQAMGLESRMTPTQGFLHRPDPLTAARFGYGRYRYG